MTTDTDDITDLSEMLGAEIDFSKIPNWKINARKHKENTASDYYDDETKKVIQKQFRFDFKNFGYKF